jgi:hypothetical protein
LPEGGYLVCWGAVLRFSLTRPLARSTSPGGRGGESCSLALRERVGVRVLIKLSGGTPVLECGGLPPLCFPADLPPSCSLSSENIEPLGKMILIGLRHQDAFVYASANNWIAKAAASRQHSKEKRPSVYYRWASYCCLALASQPYSGPKLSQARKSAPSGSIAPNAVHTLGRKMFSSGTLCMYTGMRNIDARVINWLPIWP